MLKIANLKLELSDLVSSKLRTAYWQFVKELPEDQTQKTENIIYIFLN